MAVRAYLNGRLRAAHAAWGRLPLRDRDRGDVPGWVMVTVMTAILVVAIIGVFEPAIKGAITDALDKVTNSK